MSTTPLLIVTALIEAGTGIALLVMPSFTVELLLGEGLTSPQALVLARVTGAALFSIGLVCWLGREGGPQRGLVVGMLIYNIAVAGLLLHASIALLMHGIALLPASVLHLVLAVWCAVWLRPSR